MMRWFSIAGVVVALDQVTKWVVTSQLDYGDRVSVLPIFSWVRWHNDGAAFSMLAGGGGFQDPLFPNPGRQRDVDRVDAAVGDHLVVAADRARQGVVRDVGLVLRDVFLGPFGGPARHGHELPVPAAADRLALLTRAHVGQTVSIVVGDRIVSQVVVQTPIDSGIVLITGLSDDETERLREALSPPQ